MAIYERLFYQIVSGNLTNKVAAYEISYPQFKAAFYIVILIDLRS